MERVEMIALKTTPMCVRLNEFLPTKIVWLLLFNLAIFVETSFAQQFNSDSWLSKPHGMVRSSRQWEKEIQCS
jgi:hypothetical protein